MRLTPITPGSLNREQRELFENIQAVLGSQDRGFVTAQADGAMVGPYNIMLHFPHLGNAVWHLITALGEKSTVSPGIRELVMLVTGAHFSARYEIYAHEHSGQKHGLSNAKLASLACGIKPNDLSDEEEIAFNMAKALVAGGQLPESTYEVAVSQFGSSGTAELLHLIGAYCMVSVLLNAYDVPVPQRDNSNVQTPEAYS